MAGKPSPPRCANIAQVNHGRRQRRPVEEDHRRREGGNLEMKDTIQHDGRQGGRSLRKDPRRPRGRLGRTAWGARRSSAGWRCVDGPTDSVKLDWAVIDGPGEHIRRGSRNSVANGDVAEDHGDVRARSSS